MKRREFLTLVGGATAAGPITVLAQQPGPMRRIGFLRAAPPPQRELDAFLNALADRGYVQGRNFVLVPQWGDGNVARLPELAVALTNAAVDVIVAEGAIVARAAAAVTLAIPIVMVGARRCDARRFDELFRRPPRTLSLHRGICCQNPCG